MNSYEKDISDRIERGESLPNKLDISTIKYFWQANPLTGHKSGTIPKFLRHIKVLKNFTDNELRLLSKYLHLRTFEHREVIFKQSDLGVGFYFIYSGNVDVVLEAEDDLSSSDSQELDLILSLEKFDYFGELALLQENSIRSATVVSRDHCELLGIFKPDVDGLIENEPIIAAKLLQSISVIIANRLYSLTKEVKELKYKLSVAEKKK